MLKKLGYESISRNGKRFYPGIRLKEYKATQNNGKDNKEHKELLPIIEENNDPRDEIPNW